MTLTVVLEALEAANRLTPIFNISGAPVERKLNGLQDICNFVMKLPGMTSFPSRYLIITRPFADHLRSRPTDSGSWPVSLADDPEGQLHIAKMCFTAIDRHLREESAPSLRLKEHSLRNTFV